MVEFPEPAAASDARIRMQYIGVVSLLARIAGHKLDDEKRMMVKRALDDCAAAFPGRFEVSRVTGKLGWALEPKT